MHHFTAHELADAWELRAGLTDASAWDRAAAVAACLRECAAELRSAAAPQPAQADEARIDAMLAEYREAVAGWHPAPHRQVERERYTKAHDAVRAALMAAPQPAQAACPNCHGSGEITLMTGHLGPDDYEYQGTCDHCNGNGDLESAYTGVVQQLDKERADKLKLSGKLYGLKHFPDAREAFLLEVGEDLARWKDPIGYWKGKAARQAAQAPAALAAPQPEAQPRWIPVEERLPPINTEVLVAFDAISIAATGQYSGSPRDLDRGGWCYPSENSGTCDDGSDPKVTHWMPLPAAPSAQAEPTDTAGALMQQIREVCAATLKAGPGVAVPMPDAVRSEMQLFMRGEPNLIERLPFCDVVALSESEEVQALAAPSAQAEQGGK